MSATASRRTRSAGLSDVLRVRVELWLAVLFMALAFGAGMAVRVTTEPAAPAATTIGTGVTGVSEVAPPLSDAQIAAGLPAGHPNLTDDANGGGSKANPKGDTKGDTKANGGTKTDLETGGAGSAGTP
jgi:hypothetical protein